MAWDAHDLRRPRAALRLGGVLRLVVPTRSWDSYLELGGLEIRQYGAGSPQACRRLRAMLRDLERTVLPVNRACGPHGRSSCSTGRGAPDSRGDDRWLAMGEDRQGLGGATPRGQGQDLRQPPLSGSDRSSATSGDATAPVLGQLGRGRSGGR